MPHTRLSPAPPRSGATDNQGLQQGGRAQSTGKRSGSAGHARRQQLLDRVLDDYETVSPGVDESADIDDPAQLVSNLARKKADTVSRRSPQPGVFEG